ncbi:MAG: DUF1003 domain-containing protein [Chloroflexi bacterium]|nr:MAG: DUF1003 domain-containing protein [Chloroflexota bacterium]
MNAAELLNRLNGMSEEEMEAYIDSLIDEIDDIDNLLSPQAQSLIEDLRPLPVADDVYEEIEANATFGQRIADKLTNFAGSWTFIILFLIFMAFWMGANLYLGPERAFDPYPFILLNLALSTLAGLQAPVILMSQNRQSEKDRLVARNDFEVNLKNEVEIADLHRKVDLLTELIENQSRLIGIVTAMQQRQTRALSNGHATNDEPTPPEAQ